MDPLVRSFYFCFSLLLYACNGRQVTRLNENTKADTSIVTINTTQLVDSNATASFTTPAPVKPPSGIYSVLLPFGTSKMEYTIAFYGNTYHLQESYREHKIQKVALTEGTWAVSGGYIWIYKDDVVRGRFLWKGDTLQYFNPEQHKNYSMHQLIPAMNNGALVVKKREGSKLFGVGNEPFWSVEIKKNDSMSFSLPEWNHPVTMKVAGREKKGDTLIYFATADSLRLTTTVLPYFCSDGMSDFIYSHKITVNYNGRKYNGCGVKYQ